MFVNASIFNKFVVWKYQEIQSTLSICKKFYTLAGEKDISERRHQFVLLVKLIFVESFYLARMFQINMEAEYRLLEKHKLYATGLYETPAPEIGSSFQVSECHKLRR